MTKLEIAWQSRLKLRAEGNKLRAEGNKLWAEGNKLWAEGNKLRAEGNKLWAEAIIEVHGPEIIVDWSHFPDCIVEGIRYTD